MFGMASGAGKSREEVVQETLLWHGTSKKTNPKVICMGQDGIDFRRVRMCHAFCALSRLQTLSCSRCFRQDQTLDSLGRPRARNCSFAVVGYSTGAVHTSLTLRRTLMRATHTSQQINQDHRSIDS